MTALYIAPPQFVGGCRNLYNVFRPKPDGSKVFLGRIYAHAQQYPNHYALSRPELGAVWVDLQPFEQYELPDDNGAWGKCAPWHVPDAAKLSDAELIEAAAEQLSRLSDQLTAEYMERLPVFVSGGWVAHSERPIQYSKGPWAAGCLSHNATRQTLSSESIRFGAAELVRFYVAHKDGSLARLSPYWHTAEPGNPYSYAYLRWRVSWLSGEAKPLPKHLTAWLSSRLDCR